MRTVSATDSFTTASYSFYHLPYYSCPITSLWRTASGILPEKRAWCHGKFFLRSLVGLLGVFWGLFEVSWSIFEIFLKSLWILLRSFEVFLRSFWGLFEVFLRSFWGPTKSLNLNLLWIISFQPLASHHLHPPDLVLFGCLCSPHRILESSASMEGWYLSKW